MMPSSDLLTIASSDDSTMAASQPAVGDACLAKDFEGMGAPAEPATTR
jgi:hypothetical protein